MSKIESLVVNHERIANEQSRANRELYSSHRQQLTAALLGACPKPGGRLALLGAGNCNDVELKDLLTVFSEIHLVDIDSAALSSARAQLSKNLQARIFSHAPVDLSGLIDVWDAARTKVPTFAEIDAWATRGSQNVQNRLPGPFELVASCCVLTQMSWGLTQSFGKNHPSETQARESLVAAHLRSMCGLAAGGRALFACDMISTEYYPLDDLPPHADLTELMERLIGMQNFYKGGNPVLVRRLLRRDPVLAASVRSTQWHTPWLWHGHEERTYLVYAVTLDCARE
jgi:hypothetical protein